MCSRGCTSIQTQTVLFLVCECKTPWAYTIPVQLTKWWPSIRTHNSTGLIAVVTFKGSVLFFNFWASIGLLVCCNNPSPIQTQVSPSNCEHLGNLDNLLSFCLTAGTLTVTKRKVSLTCACEICFYTQTASTNTTIKYTVASNRQLRMQKEPLWHSAGKG